MRIRKVLAVVAALVVIIGIYGVLLEFINTSKDFPVLPPLAKTQTATPVSTLGSLKGLNRPRELPKFVLIYR